MIGRGVSAGVVLLALASGGPALARTPEAGEAPAESAVESRGADGRRIFLPGFFADYRPATAASMVSLVPGFSIDQGSGARGLGGTGGNVLIDGSRPTAKDQSIEDILSAIPAAQVERVELLEGAAAGAAASGQSLVVNVVRKAGARPSSAVEARGGVHTNGFVTPDLELTHSRTIAGYTLELGAGYEYDEYVNLTGHEGFLDNRGQLLEYGPNDDRRRSRGWTVRGSINGTTGGTKLSLNLQTAGFEHSRRWVHTPSLPGASQPFRVDQGRDGFEQTRWELGASAERQLMGWKATANLLASSRDGADSSLAGFNRVGAPRSFTRFTSGGTRTERVGRLALGRSFGAHAVEFGGEFARNEQDISNRFAVGDGITFTIILDPREINDTTVAEDRWEAFVSDSWTIGPQLTVDTTLTGEWSTIGQTGDARRERSFFYLKPRLSFSWKPAEAWTVRGRTERQLGQLDFGAFAFSSEVGDGTGRVGNTNLRPDQTWYSELSVERRWGQRGTVKLNLVREAITDAFAVVPVDSNGDGRIDGEALGNVPEARRHGFDLEATLPLDSWIAGLEAGIGWRWREGRIRDPLTGRDRPLDDWDGNNLSLNITQKFPERNWEWGAWMWMGSKSWSFQAAQTLEWPAHDGWGIWASTKQFDRWTIEVGIEDPQGHTFRRVRTIWRGDRRDPSFDRQQYRERSHEGSAYISVRREL